jgi:TonB family protein
VTLARLARWGGLALVLAGCATTPPAPKRWEPQLSAELREACNKAPVECRQTGEKLAASWTTDDDAFGALKAFTGACQAGDVESCATIDRRFTRVKLLSLPVAPAFPKEAREKRLQGTWAATCTVARTGAITNCTVERPTPELDGPFLDFFRTSVYAAPTLDGRAFECEYRFEFKLSIH